MAPSGRRPRDAAATREALLAAAREHFRAASYEQVGLRAIAATAGVNPALINRYFGTKADLFLEAMKEPGLASLFDGEPADLPERLTRYCLEGVSSGASYDQLLALMRSARNEQAAGLLRDSIQQHVAPLTRRLEVSHPEVRAELAIAMLMGLGIVRNVLQTEPMASLDKAALAELLTPVLRACFSGMPEARDPDAEDESVEQVIALPALRPFIGR